MKKLRWILVVLLLAGVACSTFSGGGSGGANNSAPSNAAANDTAANDAAAEPAANDDAADSMPAGDADDSGGTAGGGGGVRVSSELATDSLCFTAYWPVNQEVTWTYQIESPGAEPTEYVIEITDVTADSFTSTSIFQDFNGEVVWDCGPDGLFNSDFSQFDLAALPGDVVDVSEITVEGVTLPSDELWAVGYSWPTYFEVAMNMSAEGVSMETSTVVNIENTITAVESVTVPVGTFENAYRVEQTGSISMDFMGVEMGIPISTTTWYVKDVGMVKTVSSSDFGSSTTVLVAID